jgi:hypothetical protein
MHEILLLNRASFPPHGKKRGLAAPALQGDVKSSVGDLLQAYKGLSAG